MIDQDFEDGENHGPSLRSNHLEDVFFGMRPAARAVWFLRHKAMKSGSSGDGPLARNQRRDADFVQWGELTNTLW